MFWIGEPLRIDSGNLATWVDSTIPSRRKEVILFDSSTTEILYFPFCLEATKPITFPSTPAFLRELDH